MAKTPAEDPAVLIARETTAQAQAESQARIAEAQELTKIKIAEAEAPVKIEQEKQETEREKVKLGASFASASAAQTHVFDAIKPPPLANLSDPARYAHRERPAPPPPADARLTLQPIVHDPTQPPDRQAEGINASLEQVIAAITQHQDKLSSCSVIGRIMDVQRALQGIPDLKTVTDKKLLRKIAKDATALLKVRWPGEIGGLRRFLARGARKHRIAKDYSHPHSTTPEQDRLNLDTDYRQCRADLRSMISRIEAAL
ncbi:MAG: hypothetical protein V1926_02255 [Candidatus Peregrinibacteria bacterium]